MYLIERVIGQLIYLLLLGISCYLIYKNKRIKIVLFFYILSLTIVSFCFVPNKGSDLYRLIPIMRGYSKANFTELVVVLKNTTTPMTILYMYTVGKFNIDGLLPAITCFLYYNNIFYILRKSIKKYKISGKKASLILLFIMSTGTLVEVIAGIRTMLGFSFIAVCYYDELIEKKKFWKNIHIYIIMSLVHPACILLFLIRLFYFYMKNNKSVLSFFSKILTFSFMCILLLGKGNNYIQAFFEKGKDYFTGDSYSYFWEYIIGVNTLIIIIIMIFYSKNLKRNKEMREVIVGFSIFLILVIFEYNTFHRVIIFLQVISIPLLGSLLSSRKKNIVKRRIFYFSIITLLIVITRGNLSSLKLFIL